MNYEEARFRIINTQLNKLKSATTTTTTTTTKTEIMLQITKKNFQDEEFPHELFQTTR